MDERFDAGPLVAVLCDLDNPGEGYRAVLCAQLKDGSGRGANS